MLYRVLQTFPLGQRRFREGIVIDHAEIEANSPLVPVSQFSLMGLIEPAQKDRGARKTTPKAPAAVEAPVEAAPVHEEEPTASKL